MSSEDRQLCGRHRCSPPACNSVVNGGFEIQPTDNGFIPGWDIIVTDPEVVQGAAISEVGTGCGIPPHEGAYQLQLLFNGTADDGDYLLQVVQDVPLCANTTSLTLSFWAVMDVVINDDVREPVACDFYYCVENACNTHFSLQNTYTQYNLTSNVSGSLTYINIYAECGGVGTAAIYLDSVTVEGSTS